jgi:hypothetical protein
MPTLFFGTSLEEAVGCAKHDFEIARRELCSVVQETGQQASDTMIATTRPDDVPAPKTLPDGVL